MNSHKISLYNLQEIVQELYKTDLDYYIKQQKADPLYPLVSLFNIDNDPEESTNLAEKYPGLVKTLLREAERCIERAPHQWRGDMIHADAPVSKQHGWLSILRSLGTQFEEVVPFGMYLTDDEDLTQLTYVRMVNQQLFEGLWILGKVFSIYIIFPLILIFCALKYI